MAYKTQPLPLASYQLPDLRAGSKRLIGCYPEMAQQTQPDDQFSQNPATLRRWPGTSLFTPSGFTNPLRGMWEMAGTVYAVIGFDLYTVSSAGTYTLVPGSSGGITGTGFVRMTDNQACLVILVPGTDTCYTYTPFSGGGGFQQLTNSFFLNLGGAIDCWYVDGFIVFLANNNGGNGSFTFFNDDGKIQRMRSYYDKLGLEQRVAAKAPGIKGWVFRKLINFMVAQGQKGLS